MSSSSPTMGRAVVAPCLCFFALVALLLHWLIIYCRPLDASTSFRASRPQKHQGGTLPGWVTGLSLNQSPRPGSSCKKPAPPIGNVCWKLRVRGGQTVCPSGGERCPRCPDMAIGTHLIPGSTPTWANCSRRSLKVKTSYLFQLPMTIKLKNQVSQSLRTATHEGQTQNWPFYMSPTMSSVSLEVLEMTVGHRSSADRCHQAQTWGR